MPRNRMIKTEFWTDEKIGRLTPIARLMFIGLWNLSDDYGVVKGSAVYVKSQLFAYDESITSGDVSEWINGLCDTGMLLRFTVRDEQLLYIANFRKHQTVDRPSKTRNCSEEDIKQALDTYSANTQRALDEHSTHTRRTLDEYSTSTLRAFDEDSSRNQPKTAPKQPEMAKIDQKQVKNDGDTVLDPSVSDFDHVFIYNTIDNTNVFNNKYPENVEQPPKPGKKSKSVRTHSVEATAYADYFASTLPSTVKVTESMRLSWAKVYDDMIRLDKRTHDEIYEVTAWARDDGFWRRNFLSANKLRNKNDDGITYYELFLTTIRYKMNKNGNRQQQPGQREQVTAEDAVRQHNDLRRIFGLEGGSEAVGSTAMALGAAAKN